MDASVTWKSGLSFDGTADSGFEIAIGSGPDVEEGTGDGFRPMELMLLSLAGCTAMDVISILEKKRQAVTAFRVEVHGERSPEHPKVFTTLHVRYVVTGRSVDPAAVQRAMELSETKYCPAQAMLRKAAHITSSYQIIEAA